jgi:hypothetical protein
MCLEITPQSMAARIRTNVKDELNPLLKITPLFLKNIVMNAVFNSVGERKSSLTLSNLGNVKLPSVMDEYIDRFDFVLGCQKSAPYNVGMLSYKGKVYMNFIRNICEPKLEMAMYRVLRDLGIHVKCESNEN